MIAKTKHKTFDFSAKCALLHNNHKVSLLPNNKQKNSYWKKRYKNIKFSWKFVNKYNWNDNLFFEV